MTPLTTGDGGVRMGEDAQQAPMERARVAITVWSDYV